MINRQIFRCLPLAICFVASGASASTSALTAQEVLTQFNLVVLGNATSYSDVDGRSYVGGNVAGGIYEGHWSATPASNYAGLTVGGNASGLMVDNGGAFVAGSLSSSTVNNGASVVYGTASNSSFNGTGTAYAASTSGWNNFNSGRVYSLTGALQTEATAAASTNFGAVLTGLSTQLSHLSGTGGTISYNGSGRATFNAVAGANGVAVFDLTASDATKLFSQSEFDFNMGGASTLIFNVDGANVNIDANFLGGSAQAIGAKTLWNFYDASSVNIVSQFGGTVLAAGAAFTNWNNIEGDVLVKSLDQHGEIHLQPFSGTVPAVPEPETYAMMMVGLGLLGAVVRRRRA